MTLFKIGDQIINGDHIIRANAMHITTENSIYMFRLYVQFAGEEGERHYNGTEAYALWRVLSHHCFRYELPDVEPRKEGK